MFLDFLMWGYCMIEFGSLFGFLIVNTIVLNFYPVFYAQTMCATTSLCLAFILFGRVFLHIVIDKVWRANTRHFLMCLFYLTLLNLGVGALYYFSNDPATVPCRLIQLFAYLIHLSMFLFVKIADFRSSKLYGRTFLICQIIDCILILILAITDIRFTSEFINNSSMGFIIILLALLSFLNYGILKFRDYWMHKKALMSKLDTKIKNNEIRKVLIDPKTIRNSSVLREAAYVLDNAPFRVVEINLIVKQLHDLLELNGWSTQEATKFCGDFSSIMIRNLMKRKYDFSLFPRPIVKLLQTYNRDYVKSEDKKNKRSFSLSI